VIHRLYVIAGPTASGKSGLAAALAERVGGRIINADSMQVYRDLAVLTARPDPTLLARAPHRLYGVLDGADICSAARWAGLAKAEIDACSEAGEVPIVCGGSGLYLSTLLHGIAQIPDIPAAVRIAARSRHAEIGAAAFRRELAALDPLAAATLAEGDSQRLIRAFEVATATGRTLADWQRRVTRFLSPDLTPFVALLAPPRRELYQTIDRRFQSMLDQGAIDEVRRLIARRLDPATPILKALGVTPLTAYLAGKATLAAAVERAQWDSHQYAKRQTTWFRHRLTAAMTISEQLSERNCAAVCHNICQAA
jgi:tRNA dimethylallyltransferase